jgi:hypothetical protein
LDARIATNTRPTLRPGVTDKASGTLRASFTARPGVPDRPSLTWCALNTSVATRAGDPD